MNYKQYILNYWNVPGRGESVRVMLALGEINFKNNYIPLPFPMENPPGLKPIPFDDGTWNNLKPKMPWGTLPTLELPSGKIIGQQRSILRYLAKNIKYRDTFLYPDKNEDAVLVDSFMDMLEDIWPILIGLNGPESIETAPLYSTMLGLGTLDDFLNPRMEEGKGDLALQFDFLENAIDESGPFLLGQNLSCADILLFSAISWWGSAVFPEMDAMLNARPKIERSIRSVGKIESISKYYEKLKDSRKAMPTVGVTNYADYYKNFHKLCDIS